MVGHNSSDGDMEKEQVSHINDGSLEAGEGHFDAAATKVLLRRLDWHLVPFLSLLYLLSFLDRSNIGNARLANLEEDLNMHGLQYNVSLAVFFPFYVLAEIPSNLMMKRTSPSIWLSFIMVWWAIIMTLMGLVQSYAGLLVARMALGIAEGGLFPGVTFYITLWYRRHECGLRMAIFFSAATIAGAFGGLLARAIAMMDGVAGRSGWSWIFILEGLATFIVAVAAYWIINDYPATANFLNAEEKVEVERRLKEDRTSLADEYDIKYFFDAIKDWKIYVHMLLTFGIYTPLYSISLFLPTIVKGMGYTNEDSQLMSVPPYVAACAVTVVCGYVADKQQRRGIYMAGCCIVAMIGFILLLSTDRPKIHYLGCFFIACGIYPNVPMGVAWNGNNIGGSTKRAIGIAMHVGFGNLGGILAAFSYRKTDAPRYFSGHGLLLGTTGMSFCLILFMMTWLKKENARRDRLMTEQGLTLESYTEEMKDAERERGDYATFYRYTT